MSLTTTEEALVRQLLDQQAAILSLASSESTIISKLGATKVTIADLPAAGAIADADLFIIRQGTSEKNVTGAVVKALASGSIGGSTETTAGVVELATAAETQTGTDNSRAIHPAGLASLTATESRAGLVELATIAEAATGTDTARAITAAGSSLVTKQIQPVTASVATNALTITLQPTVIDFRSSTLGSGTVNRRHVSSNISIVVSSGSTLGTVSATQSKLAVLAIDNAGTVELAVVNLSGGTKLDETGVISTTAEGGAGASDSASTVYSTTARSNVPYRVVGYVESTQATAGTWATAPSTIQGSGGNAMTAMSSIGYGQTWQNVTGSRAGGVTYYNTTGKPIFVNLILSADIPIVTVNGVAITASVSGTRGPSFIVPPGGSYSTTVPTGIISIWCELR